MIAVLVEVNDVAFDGGGGVADYRTAVFACDEGVVAELAVLGIDVLEERHREVLLTRTEHREGELLGLFYEFMGGGIGLDADNHERGSKARLSGPIDRCNGLLVAIFGAKDLQTIG